MKQKSLPRRQAGKSKNPCLAGRQEKAKIQIKYQKFLLVVIIALGLALRLVNLQQWFHFEMDEEVIAWKLRPFLQEGRPFLIGGGTPFGFHLGPGFYYLSAIPLFFSSLDPIGWGAAAAVLGTATIFLMWLAGKNLYGRRVGLIAALMWATSFTAVMSDRHWWPLVLDPMLSLIVILCLYKICVIPAKARFDSARRAGIYINRFRVEHGMTWIALGLALAFAWQADLTVLPLFLAAGVVAVLNFRRQWKGILAAAGILAVSFLPLILFEWRHPGVNLGKLLQRSNLYSLQRLDLYTLAFIPQSLSRLLFPITNLDGNLLNFYSWCGEITDGRVAGQPWWVAGVTTMLLIIPFVSEKFAKRNDLADKVLRLIIISGIAGILMFKLLGGNLYDFYLAVLYPVVLILAARSTDFIWRKWGGIAAGVIMVVIVGLNLTAIANAYHPQGLAIKREAVEWTKEQLNGREFELDSLSGCSRYNGVRYLFFLENMEPAKSFVDQDLSWLYPSYDEQSRPEYLVTFSTPNDLTEQDRERYQSLSEQAEVRQSFGELEILITKIIYE